nr:response regulator [Azospirillum sp. SYSU D00513]
MLAAFEIEHQDHLASIREALRLTESTGEPPDLIDVHRRAHSLKGAARAVDLPDVEAISHRLEEVFLAVQAGTVPLDAGTVSVVRRSLDAIEDVVAWATRGGEEVALADLLADLDRLAGARAAPRPAETAPAAVVETAARAGGAAPERRAADADTPSLVRVGSEGLERLFTATAALLPEVEAQAGLAAQLRQLRGEWRALDRSWRDIRARMDKAGAKETADKDGMEAMLAGFERRLRGLGGGLDGVHRSHDRLLWSLRRWGGGLQEDVSHLRMVPAESTFRGLGRMIRELSRSQGKEVEVDLRGMEVKADRAVLQRLKDPILHIARNTVGHGIETPREREAAGKRPAASVRVEAETVGSRLRIRVEDDGRGLNLEAIARRAVEHGFLSEEEATAALSDGPAERLAELLFEPGFSTAESTTEISGRGMGMAIARREVKALQGTLTITERAGGGTAVTIEVPLSLLSQRLVFVRVQDSVLALPSADVARLVRTDAGALLTGSAVPMVRIDGEDVPLAPLAALLGMEAPAVPKEGQRLLLALVRAGERRMAVILDEFLHTADTVVASAEESGIDAARFLGTVLLADGSPAIVLNVAGLFPAAGAEMPRFVRPAEAAPAARPHILVVDDSITTRTLEKSILEAHGYRVTQCVDGREALERLLEGIDVELVISDVEMPRMDGFALLQAVKSTPRTADLPVILVTSRASDEDKERGLRLGADAYIVKTRFDQNELLAGIRRLI